MIKIYIIIIFLAHEFMGLFSYAQTSATIPTYHWAYDYLHQLRVRGYLTELNTIGQPYVQSDILNSLARLQNQIQQGKITPTAQDRWLIDLLIKEFQVSQQSEGLIFEPGIWADQSIHYGDEQTKIFTQLRSQVGVGLGEKLYFYNGIRLDQQLRDDPIYIGNEWRGFAGYTEQAYLRITNDEFRITNFEFQLTIGRDFLNWGAGKTGRLLLSDQAQPLDQIAVDFKYKGLQFTLLAAQLDQWKLADSLVKTYGTLKANRYLSAHRLTISLKNKFHIGLTEALLYGGPDANWELKYHNPLLYYHGELLNGGGSDGNGLLYLDWDWYPGRNWEFYGEILVDDFQLEKTGPGDLEPNEVGTILGLQCSDLLGLRGSLLGLEYVRITNRTYNSGFEWEKFVHFNRPIGYSLGNNFDRWNFMANYWLAKGLQIGFEYDHIRQGEGSILDGWNTPWLSHTVAEGYDEPFPYGVIEKSSILTVNLKYHFRTNTMIESQVNYQTIENVFHEIGVNRGTWSFYLVVHWNWETRFNY